MDHSPFVSYQLPPLSAPQPTFFPPMDIDLPERAPSATSSERSTLSPPGSPELQPTKAPARYDQLGMLDEDHAALERRAMLAAYPVQRSFPRKVAQGVMSDGRWTVEHLFVQAFLRNPTGRPTISYRPAMAIYALAAVSVMWRPAHPAYEVFWNQEEKKATAEFIDSVVHMKDSPVDTYPHSWLGPTEIIWQLTGIQREYAKIRARELGISPQTSSRKMTLRKRKAVQNVAAVEHTPDDIAEELEPPKKRARKSKPTPKAAAAMEAVCAANEDGAANGVSADTVASTAASDSSTNMLTTPSPLTASSSLPSGSSTPDDQEVKKTKSRSRRSAKKDSAAPATSSRSSARRGVHERSPSTSGSSTSMSSLAVDLTRGRSSSSASDTTVIEPIPIFEGKAKGKDKALDIADLAEAARQVASASVEPEEAPVHATRARTRAAAKRGTAEPETASASPAPEAPAKAAKSSPRKRSAATPDTFDVETAAEAEDQDEPVSVPKKRKRASAASRARSGRRR